MVILFYGCFVALSQYSVISIQQLFSVGTIAVKCSLSLDKLKIDEKNTNKRKPKNVFSCYFIFFLCVSYSLLLKLWTKIYFFLLHFFVVFGFYWIWRTFIGGINTSRTRSKILHCKCIATTRAKATAKFTITITIKTKT